MKSNPRLIDASVVGARSVPLVIVEPIEIANCQLPNADWRARKNELAIGNRQSAM